MKTIPTVLFYLAAYLMLTGAACSEDHDDDDKEVTDQGVVTVGNKTVALQTAWSTLGYSDIAGNPPKPYTYNGDQPIYLHQIELTSYGQATTPWPPAKVTRITLTVASSSNQRLDNVAYFYDPNLNHISPGQVVSCDFFIDGELMYNKDTYTGMAYTLSSAFISLSYNDKNDMCVISLKGVVNGVATQTQYLSPQAFTLSYRGRLYPMFIS